MLAVQVHCVVAYVVVLRRAVVVVEERPARRSRRLRQHRTKHHLQLVFVVEGVTV